MMQDGMLKQKLGTDNSIGTGNGLATALMEGLALTALFVVIFMWGIMGAAFAG